MIVLILKSLDGGRTTNILTKIGMQKSIQCSESQAAKKCLEQR
jgi:hypothetical protein